ncbi:MAG: transglycosylase SLT domain-containing protein [Flavobacteriales bacterium]
MNKKHLLLIFLLVYGCRSFAQLLEKHRVIEVVGLHPSDDYKFVQSKQLYAEGWDKLEQPNFWRTLMTMEADSALINIGSTRQIIKKVSVKVWDKLSDDSKDVIRDSVKNHYGLPEDEHVYMTSGKKAFYDFQKVIPSIGRGIEIFNSNNVDPFYAQVILLIESPNKLQKSSVGAYGSFQIMRKVAISLGLKVNSTVDERKDFDKSAWASAKLIRTICIPETNKILNANNVAFNPNDLWYKLLVLHTYHAGAGNVRNAVNVIQPEEGDMGLITTLWQTEIGSFRNASQNYSQLALATLIELDRIIVDECKFIYNCPLTEI